jgi:hypothetical protein
MFMVPNPRWWSVWVNGPGADYCRWRGRAANWEDAAQMGRAAVAEERGHEAEEYWVVGVRLEAAHE